MTKLYFNQPEERDFLEVVKRIRQSQYSMEALNFSNNNFTKEEIEEVKKSQGSLPTETGFNNRELQNLESIYSGYILEGAYIANQAQTKGWEVEFFQDQPPVTRKIQEKWKTQKSILDICQKLYLQEAPFSKSYKTPFEEMYRYSTLALPFASITKDGNQEHLIITEQVNTTHDYRDPIILGTKKEDIEELMTHHLGHNLSTNKKPVTRKLEKYFTTH
jgi:hypothetical protein